MAARVTSTDERARITPPLHEVAKPRIDPARQIDVVPSVGVNTEGLNVRVVWASGPQNGAAALSFRRKETMLDQLILDTGRRSIVEFHRHCAVMAARVAGHVDDADLGGRPLVIAESVEREDCTNPA